jgi:hypothetical protein
MIAACCCFSFSAFNCWLIVVVVDVLDVVDVVMSSSDHCIQWQQQTRDEDTAKTMRVLLNMMHCHRWWHPLFNLWQTTTNGISVGGARRAKLRGQTDIPSIFPSFFSLSFFLSPCSPLPVPRTDQKPELQYYELQNSWPEGWTKELHRTFREKHCQRHLHINLPYICHVCVAIYFSTRAVVVNAQASIISLFDISTEN